MLSSMKNIISSLLVFGIFSSLALADEWDHRRDPGRWYAQEGQMCQNYNRYDGNSCAPGLACEQTNREYGVCVRMCRNSNDCNFGQECEYNGRVGVCRHTWNNGDGGHDGCHR